MEIDRLWRYGWKIVCLVMLWLPVPGYGLGLWESYQLAMENDPAYQRQLSLFRADGERVPQAKAALLPQVTGIASHGRGNLQVDMPDDLDTGSGGSRSDGSEVSISPFNLEPAPVPRDDNYDNSKASLTFTQTIFDRAKWLALDSAQSQVGETRLELDSARRFLVLETVQAYYDFLAAEDALETAGLELQAVERQLNLTERRYEQDIGTLTDVHESRARMELARVDTINARNNQALASHRLSKLTGTPVESVNRLPDSFDPPPLTPPTESHWVNEAMKSSITVQLAQQQANTAELELKRQESAHWPTVSFVGETAYEQESFSSLSNGEDRFRNEVSLQLRIPIFTGFAVKSRVREARYRKFAADLGVRNSKAELTRDVRSTYDSVESSRRRVETLKMAYDQNLAALELREQGYLEGLSSNLDLLDAFRDAYRARRQWLQSRYRYLVDYLDLYSLSRPLEDEVIRRMDSYLVEETE